MAKRRILYGFLTFLVLVLLALGILLTRPLVLFVAPASPKAFASRLLPPIHVSWSYVSLSLEEADARRLSSLLHPRLVVWSPLSRVDNSLGKSLQWGTMDSEADLTLEIVEEKMWSDALSKMGGRTCAFVFSRFDNRSRDLYEGLSSQYPGLIEVSYDGRLSGKALEDAETLVSGVYGVIATSPKDCLALLSSTSSKVFMDYREAAAAVSLDYVVSVTPDWSKVIPSALALDHGSLAADYTLRVLH